VPRQPPSDLSIATDQIVVKSALDVLVLFMRRTGGSGISFADIHRGAPSRSRHGLVTAD
jgi:hypothetical protein